MSQRLLQIFQRVCQNAILPTPGVVYRYYYNVAVEGVSKLSFQCGSRDAKFCVSTIWLGNLLILNILYTVSDIEARHTTSLHVIESSFDTPSTTGVGKLLIFNVLCAVVSIETRQAGIKICIKKTRIFCLFV